MVADFEGFERNHGVRAALGAARLAHPVRGGVHEAFAEMLFRFEPIVMADDMPALAEGGADKRQNAARYRVVSAERLAIHIDWDHEKFLPGSD